MRGPGACNSAVKGGPRVRGPPEHMCAAHMRRQEAQWAGEPHPCRGRTLAVLQGSERGQCARAQLPQGRLEEEPRGACVGKARHSRRVSHKRGCRGRGQPLGPGRLKLVTRAGPKVQTFQGRSEATGSGKGGLQVCAAGAAVPCGRAAAQTGPRGVFCVARQRALLARSSRLISISASNGVTTASEKWE